MKISREWLADYVDLTDLSDASLGARLTEIGHPIESMESHAGVTVFDVEFTANRVDAMSHLGLARELSAALGREMLTHTYDIAPGAAIDNSVRPVSVTISAPELCTRYTALVIEGITIRQSSGRIRTRLESVGLRPINNIVDITNYVMLAVGHPMHAFDLDRLRGEGIDVRAGRPGEKVRTLDGEVRSVDAETVIIADASGAVALGGIMGGAESQISEGTTNVLLECAHFDKSAIRRAARRLGMKTDASYRFERGIDPNDTVAALEQAAGLILGEAGGRRGAPVDVVSHATQPVVATLRTSALRQMSDGVIGIGYALDLFTRMGMHPRTRENGIEVSVPTYRGDVREEHDLVEEVVRFYGYDKIPSSLPRLTTGDIRHEELAFTEETVRDLLVGAGMVEVINYSFIHPEHNRLFSLEEPIAVQNALNENVSSMRVSLLPGLLQSAAHNRSYGGRDGALFETGRTYHRSAGTIHERERMALVLYGGPEMQWSDTRRSFDYFDVKGTIEILLERFHVESGFSPITEPWLRDGQAGAITLAGRVAGWLGAVHRDVLQRFDIKGDLFAAELSLEALAVGRSDARMRPVSRFPGIPMVLGLIHARSLTYDRLIEQVRALQIPHLLEVGVRDRYVPDDQADEVKTTLGMWYQAQDQSLTQESVVQIHQRLAQSLAATLPVKIVGEPQGREQQETL